MLSEAVPLSVSGDDVVVCGAFEVGPVMVTAGFVVSGLYVTVSWSVLVLPAASRAVTVRMLDPDCSVTELTDHDVVPLAVPLPPRLLDQVTWVTPTLSDAVPPNDIGLAVT